MIYFDNAATTFPKPTCVIDEVVKCIKLYCGNPGRSSHKLAISAAEKIYDTRERISNFIHAEKPENVVFTPNATYALNLAIKGSIDSACHCIISDMEHNSVIRPLKKCSNKYGCTVSSFDTSLPLNTAIIPLIREDTKLIITTIASNVTGQTLDIATLSSIAEKYHLKLIIDASQYLGHLPINLSNTYYHVICSAGHKALFGIQGSGFAIFRTPETIDTLVEGGNGIDTFTQEMPILLPERYESGTLCTPAIASLYSGIGFIEEVGQETIRAHLEILTERIKEILLSFPNTVIYGAENGIISFNIKGASSSYVSRHLNDCNIATRSGFHCAPDVHQKLKTDSDGAVRISLSYFNSLKECDYLYKALKKIK